MTAQNIPAHYHRISGTLRSPATAATRQGPADAGETLQVTISLRRRTDDFYRQTQIANHALDDQQLLIVLATEQRDIGLNQVEQLGDDRGHTDKMPGSHLPLQRNADLRYVDAHALRYAKRIHFLDCRGEQQVAAARRKSMLIALQRAWVAREILIRTELCRIDENAGDHTIGFRARKCNKGKVPIV